MKILILTLLIVLGTALQADARTWYVEKDSSGDFSVIQDAVDAAADGDVIRIGPGQYADFSPVATGDMVIVDLDGLKSLTFIGAGVEETIIGPEEFSGLYSDYGFGCYPGPASIRLENLRLQNFDSRGIVAACEVVELVSCVFSKCTIGVQLSYGDRYLIEDCSFIDPPSYPVLPTAITLDAPHILVRNTEIVGYHTGMSFFSAGSTDVLITGCIFNGAENGNIGLSATSNTGGTVENCYFTGWRIGGFLVNSSGDVVFRDNTIENNSGDGIIISGCDNLTMHENIVINCHTCVNINSPTTEQSIYQNHFFRREENRGYFIITNYNHNQELHLDFSNNYWGTTDTTELDHWILDGNDFNYGQMFIDYLPLADGPVSTESVTLDGIKAMFR